MKRDPLDALADLGRATDDLMPSDDFADAVMRAVEQDSAIEREQPRPSVLTHPSWWDRIGRQGGTAVAIAAVAAAACLVFAIREHNTFDDDVLATVDIVEVAE